MLIFGAVSKQCPQRPLGNSPTSTLQDRRSQEIKGFLEVHLKTLKTTKSNSHTSNGAFRSFVPASRSGTLEDLSEAHGQGEREQPLRKVHKNLMTLTHHSHKTLRFAFILFILITLPFQSTAFGR